MKFKNIILEKKGYIGIITFDHPPAKAWNLAAVEDFEKAVDALENDS